MPCECAEDSGSRRSLSVRSDGICKPVLDIGAPQFCGTLFHVTTPHPIRTCSTELSVAVAPRWRKIGARTLLARWCACHTRYLDSRCASPRLNKRERPTMADPDPTPVTAGEQLGLNRALGPFHLVALGIGAIIGAGIFVYTGTAAAQA